MSNRTINITDELHQYITTKGIRESDILKSLRLETKKLPDGIMQIAPEQGQFMAMLVQLINAKRIIEVGVYTGYSALSMASVLPSDGYLLACDINQKTTAIAQSFWQEAGVAEKIDLRLAPAVETLQHALDEGGENSFDMAFLDADKASIDAYYELCIKLLRQGGVMLLDNMLWGGQVLESNPSSDTVILQAISRKIHEDQRVDMVLLPIADGVTMVRKR